MRGLLVLIASALFAQDASLVLRTLVSYNRMANTVTLTPEKKTEVQSLARFAMAENAKGRYGEAMKLLHKGTALMHGAEWTPAISFAASLTPVLDHAVWEPGQKIQLRFERLYSAEPGAPTAIEGKVRLTRSAEAEPAVLGALTGDLTTIVAPESPAGAYKLEVIVSPIPLPKNIDVAIAPGVAARSKALSARMEGLKSREGPDFWTLRYIAGLYEKADRSAISPAVDFAQELRYAEEIAAAIEREKDPFQGRTGDMRRAYLSKVDNTLQPYRVYIPSAYTSEKATPLVVALHGMGGDENSLFDRYNSRVLQEQAEKYGWIVVAPKGRDSASMYRGSAEQDVLDVIDQVRASWNVDPKQIFVTGHSMGGYGSWSIAMNHPSLFAALGPVAGGGDASRMEKIRHIPQIVVHGDDDRTVRVTSSRTMVEAARKLGVSVKYIEVPGGGHSDVFVPAMPQVFEFFSTLTRQ